MNNKVQTCVLAAFYHHEGETVNSLNSFLDKHPFGPYDHLSEATREVQHLRKKGKNEKANRLNGLLQQFAVSQGVDKDAFDELPALMNMIRAQDQILISRSLNSSIGLQFKSRSSPLKCPQVD